MGPRRLRAAGFFYIIWGEFRRHVLILVFPLGADSPCQGESAPDPILWERQLGRHFCRRKGAGGSADTLPSSFAAAGLVVIEGRALTCLKAPLLRWGSSAAQGNGEHGQHCVFLVGPDALIGPFSGGPVCRPYEGNRNLIPHPARATARAAPTASRKHIRNPGGRVRTPAPTANKEAGAFFA